MKPEKDPHGARLWAIVAATVRPFPGRSAKPPAAAPPIAPAPAKPQPRKTVPPPPGMIEALEPGRHRRVVRGREPLADVIDLHGLNHDQARGALTAFILKAHAAGRRNVLVITGKGALGDGVLRRRTPDWLSEAPLRAVVAGLSEAHRRHGGEGALYVALRRRPTP